MSEDITIAIEQNGVIYENENFVNFKLEEKDKEIERLNKKIEQYENPEDMTLMFMWCDEKAKDEIKRLNKIIKEAKECINYYAIEDEDYSKIYNTEEKAILEILDKGIDTNE